MYCFSENKVHFYPIILVNNKIIEQVFSLGAVPSTIVSQYIYMCSGFNATFRPSTFFRCGTYLQIKINKKAKNPSRFTILQKFILNVKNVNEVA